MVQAVSAAEDLRELARFAEDLEARKHVLPTAPRRMSTEHARRVASALFTLATEAVNERWRTRQDQR